MANRYFSGFGSQEHLATEGNDIKMQTYNVSPTDRRMAHDKAFHGLAVPPSVEAVQEAASPGLILQKHQDDPPAYGDVGGHVAHQVRHIV